MYCDTCENKCFAFPLILSIYRLSICAHCQNRKISLLPLILFKWFTEVLHFFFLYSFTELISFPLFTLWSLSNHLSHFFYLPSFFYFYLLIFLSFVQFLFTSFLFLLLTSILLLLTFFPRLLSSLLLLTSLFFLLSFFPLIYSSSRLSFSISPIIFSYILVSPFPPRDPQVIELADDDDFEKILEEEKYNGENYTCSSWLPCHVYSIYTVIHFKGFAAHTDRLCCINQLFEIW